MSAKTVVRDHSRHDRRRGVVAVQVAVMLVAIIGFAALTVDVGAMYSAKSDLQRTADAAALAAAAKLNAFDEGDPLQLARTEAILYTGENDVWSRHMQLGTSDVEFGRAVYNEATGAYDFDPSSLYPDAVRVRVRMEEGSPNGSLSLYFARVLGHESADLSAEAIAMMVPRDIAVVADLSASHTDDSELRHVGLTDINLFDVWAGLPILKGNAGVGNGLDPPPPGQPNHENDQPGTGPGSPANQGGNPNPGAEPFDDDEPHGPRWGWMTGYGTWTSFDELSGTTDYDPTTDQGLYHIPRGVDTTDPDVIENLIENGYALEERDALLSGAGDGDAEVYFNRALVLTGLIGWRSKMRDEHGDRVAKYNGGPGNGDDIVDNNEMWQEVSYPFDSGSWREYIQYVAGNSAMTSDSHGDPRVRYRFGIKTAVNYMLERQPGNSQTPELADCPVQPMQAVKDAVDGFSVLLEQYDSTDQVSLEGYDRYGRHLVDLVDGSNDFTEITSEMASLQGGHFDVWTNIGDGIDEAIYTLTNDSGHGRPDKARAKSWKTIFLLTDGQANVTASHEASSSDETILAQAREHARDRASVAAGMGIRIYTATLGAGADQDLMREIAEMSDGEHFHIEGTVEEYSAGLSVFFSTLGGRRPVEIIR